MTPQTDRKTRIRRIGAAIQVACTVAVISLVLFALVNWAIDPFVPPNEQIKAKRSNAGWSEAQAQKWIDHYGLDVVRRVYPGKSDEEIRRIVFSKFQVGNRYEPFVEFVSDPIFMFDPVLKVHMGVHEAGFRFGGRDQGPWPIDKANLNVFVFGGSTAFGAGAADDETIAAYLQVLLRERLGARAYVYNFGVGAYYSSQELINFWRLARQGIHPDLVVFVDGLNDYFQKTDDTAHSGYYREFERARVDLTQQLQLDRGPLWHLKQVFQLSPAARLAARLKEHELPVATPGRESLRSDSRTVVRDFDDQDRAHVQYATERLINNFRLAAGMAGGIGAESAFIVQPTPMHAYDLGRHPFPVPEVHQYTRIGYPVLKERLAADKMKENVVWCADLAQQTPPELPLYSDPVHYTAAMHKLIAGCIMEGLNREGSIKRLERGEKN